MDARDNDPGDFEASDFKRFAFDKDVELLVEAGELRCLVVFPYYLDETASRPMIDVAAALGYVDVCGAGTYLDHHIPELDESDLNYVLLQKH